jgi:hypothetical protein
MYAKPKKDGRIGEIPTNHNPRFAPVIQPTLETGVETLVVAAGAWLPTITPDDRQRTRPDKHAANCLRCWRHLPYSRSAARSLELTTGSISSGFCYCRAPRKLGRDHPRSDDRWDSAGSHQRVAICRCLNACRADYVPLVSNRQPVKQPCAGVRRRLTGAVCGFGRG